MSGRTTTVLESLVFTDGLSLSRVLQNEQLKNVTQSLKTSKSNLAWVTMMLKASCLSAEIKWAISSLPFFVAFFSSQKGLKNAELTASPAEPWCCGSAAGSITMSCSDPPCHHCPVFPGRMLRMVREGGPWGHHSISAALQCHLGWWVCYGNISLLTTDLSVCVPKADQHSLHGNFCFPVMEARDLSFPWFS